jgi:hypothetical protein
MATGNSSCKISTYLLKALSLVKGFGKIVTAPVLKAALVKKDIFVDPLILESYRKTGTFTAQGVLGHPATVSGWKMATRGGGGEEEEERIYKNPTGTQVAGNSSDS